ncbi:hypothetical protein DM02DRAFT_614381 [Periconia macrospinosa]|uniref:L domain-like protein n=1 Tax=Periconia macrospinosa TaxID=97972 RepID=A0A2V1DT03_9PLEO|nr:hypothetical protein DM02DRAFT_614381 [Periconia macrospinosa]
MDDDLPLPLPRRVPHNHTLPRSPPPFTLLNPRYRTTSPTSSEPPLFSSDGPEAADVTNYQSPRNKKKRAGPWWDNSRDRPLERNKKTKISRNFDSGVYMMSECSDCSMELSSDPPQPPEVEPNSALVAQETFAERLDREVSHMTENEGRLYRRIIETMESNPDHFYDLDRLGLVDEDTKYLSLLKQAIYHPPDASVEIPSEGQYRSFIPKLRISLGHNSLRTLPSSLFEVDNIEYLSLRNNHISELPPQIGNFTTLHHLDISHNAIKYLPVEILRVLQNIKPFLTRAYDRNSLPSGRTDFTLGDLGNPLFYPRIPTSEPDWTTATTSGENPPQKQPWFIDFKRVLKIPCRHVAHHKHCPEKRIRSPKNLHQTFNIWEDPEALLEDPHLYMVSWTVVRYYDENGRVLDGCHPWPDPTPDTNRPIPIDSMVPTKDRGTIGLPATWFSPPSISSVPSLRSACLNTALKELESPAEVEKYLGDSITPNIKRQLDCAATNQNLIHSTLRECHVCGKEYIIPRAEWLEFWAHIAVDLVPVMVKVCSWGCVPGFIRDRPGKGWESWEGA